MNVTTSILELVWKPKLTTMSIGLSIVLLNTLVSGCGSVATNSENFYQNIPRRPINWREYMTD